MKLRSIARSGRNFKLMLPERRFSSLSGEAFNPRPSVSSIGSENRKAKLHRAKDIALKKLRKFKLHFLTPGALFPPDSAVVSSISSDT
jgi:hypothetical protein